jgi:CubicO group peptidase (beta-lactamase class C family)
VRVTGSLVLGAALVACGRAPTRPPASTAVDPAQLAAFVDEYIAAEMAKEGIPGAGFVFVQDGRVVLQRGYGVADVAAKRAVDPEKTIWRIGSISKVLTATAVMQLVDRGLVDLDAPVDRYVRRVAIPATYPDPVTVRQLLDHTAGFDEIRPGTQADSEGGVLPLAPFLEGKLVRVRPPGKTLAYSTYGITLAGELVEEVAAMPFETFLKRNVWDPLGMTRTAITRPVDADVAKGYDIDKGEVVEQPWEWYHTTPASSVNATVADMARFLEAHLALGQANGARILSERAAREMQRQQVTMDPSIPGYALGWAEDYVGDLHVLEHGGNMAGFSALAVIVPSERVGFFIVHHGENSTLRNDLKWTLLERFFPAAKRRHPVPPTLPPVQEVRAERFAGRYAPLASCWSCNPVRVNALMTLTANPDGTLSFAGGRWIAVDALRFVQERGSGYIVFRNDESGAVHEVFAGGSWGWQKLPN